MEIVTLEEIKANSRIEHDMEDKLIEQIGETSEAMVCAIMERDFADLREDYGEVPEPVRRAVLVLCDHLYIHRSAVANVQLWQVPYSIDFMIKPYCKLV